MSIVASLASARLHSSFPKTSRRCLTESHLWKRLCSFRLPLHGRPLRLHLS